MSWLRRIFGGRPKAEALVPADDHVENLAAHPSVMISPIGQTGDLPIWVDFDPASPTQQTYGGLLWEVEPTGEYLYYLAGEFPKNEKGLLRYGSCRTMAEVHVCFETDVIDVARHAPPRFEQAGRDNATDTTDYLEMTVGQISELATQRSADAGLDRGFAALGFVPPPGGYGFFQMKDDFEPGPWLRLVWEKIDDTAQGPRLTHVRVLSKDVDAPFAPLHDLFGDLVNRYAAIVDHPLSGAIRM